MRGAVVVKISFMGDCLRVDECLRGKCEGDLNVADEQVRNVGVTTCHDSGDVKVSILTLMNRLSRDDGRDDGCSVGPCDSDYVKVLPVTLKNEGERAGDLKDTKMSDQDAVNGIAEKKRRDDRVFQFIKTAKVIGSIQCIGDLEDMDEELSSRRGSDEERNEIGDLVH
jgi:hypothetical protein